ncbi:MAG TPA: exodeoxyribonuclease VII large subunit [Anaeromyxobacteraceae bacterium]|nr:exodeoxyribonuclease VII large subunit [Anaeromyxobacteraceae bacterium]
MEPRSRLRALVRRAEEATRRLGRWQALTFPRERLRVERLAARLEPANVAKLLQRGFALVLKGSHLVTHSGMAEAGEALRVALARGWLDVQVVARNSGDDPLPGRADAPGEVGGRGGG